MANVVERSETNINDEINIAGDMKSLDDSNFVIPQSPNISFGTLDALENAEKLVNKAKQMLIETIYCNPIHDVVSDRQFVTTELDENELYIRDIVTAKFQQANTQMYSNAIYSTNKKLNPENNNLSRVQRIICKKPIENKIARCRGVREKMDVCKECSMNKNKKKVQKKISSEMFDNEISTRADIKPQLTLRNVEKFDLLPVQMNCKIMSNNVRTYEVNHELSKQTTINVSLIDAAIQTSFCELSNEDNALLNKLTELPVDIVQSSSVRCVNQHQTIENSAMHLDELRRINCEDKNVKEISDDKLKGSFLDFLCHMGQLENIEGKNSDVDKDDKNNFNDSTELSENDDEFYYNFNYKEIILTPPDANKFNKIIRNLDVKIDSVCNGIDEFKNEFCPLTTDCKADDHPATDTQLLNKTKTSLSTLKIIESQKKTMNSKERNIETKCNDIHPNVTFLLEPRSRISSTNSSESSETILPPARFSTPLNNYRQVDGSVINIDVNSSYDTIEKFFIPTIEFDIKNDATNVHMTRNKFSSISSSVGKKIDAVNNIDNNSRSIDGNNGENILENIQSIATRLSLSSQSNQQSTENSKFKTDNAQQDIDNEVHCNNELEDKINIVDHFLQVEMNNSIKSATINSSNDSDNDSGNVNSKNSRYSSEITKNDCINLNINEENDKEQCNERSNVIVLDTINPTSTELSIRDRTSLDISAIYSESFENSSITELTSPPKIIDKDNNKTSILIDTNVEKINCIDNVENIQTAINEISHHSTENKSDKSLSQLLTSSNSNYEKSDEKNGSVKNTISISSSLSSSQRKLLINSTSSLQTLNEIKTKFSSDDCYSEGEFYLPSSCSYSLGEIRPTKHNEQNNISKKNITTSAQSSGEILELDIKSNFSIEKILNN